MIYYLCTMKYYTFRTTAEQQTKRYSIKNVQTNKPAILTEDSNAEVASNTRVIQEGDQTNIRIEYKGHPRRRPNEHPNRIQGSSKKETKRTSGTVHEQTGANKRILKPV